MILYMYDKEEEKEEEEEQEQEQEKEDEEEEEEEEEEEVATRALRRGPAGSASRLACTIAIQLRMYHKTLVSLTCGADM